MQDPKYLDNDEYLSMAKALEVHRKEEQLFDRDWYDPDFAPYSSYVRCSPHHGSRNHKLNLYY